MNMNKKLSCRIFKLVQNNNLVIKACNYVQQAVLHKKRTILVYRKKRNIKGENYRMFSYTKMFFLFKRLH